ncbi:MAG: NADH-dependent [FeFe] hydrogenase, group A6 [Bacillota bacterium]|nr:NADH-dependent [FeFe] hydrogenase, group A6 [Bacillota bacterium]
MRTVRVFLDGREALVPEGTNIVEAARANGVEIPTLCYLKGVNEPGCCRVCLVEVDGARGPVPACVTPVRNGMRITTNSPRIRRLRRRVLELLLYEHHTECPVCPRAETCELRSLATRYGVRPERVARQGRRRIADRNPFIIRDYDKCIKCRRCEAVCRHVQGVGALTAMGRGIETTIGPAFGADLGNAACVSCGQCVMVCPTAALTERSYINEVWEALDDPDRFVVVQTAPAIQVSLGEEFGMPAGTVVTGKMAAALRRMGFDRVFSTEFAADVTIVEEAHELLERLEGHGELPLISSCSPGWVKFCEHFYPEFLDNLSTCKSPAEMLGALVKSYFAGREGLDPRKITVVAVMPCTAKKFEAARPELVSEMGRDVDFVLTTRELARMIRQAGLRFAELAEEQFDAPLGIATGAGALFATTGGVMEAAIRTAYALTEGEEMARVEFHRIRGLQGVREAEVELKGRRLRVAVAHGTRNARRLLERIKAGEKFDFLEIMGCPGGCIGGGGQPIVGTAEERVGLDRRKKRAQALFSIDVSRELRRAHENPAVKKLYEEFLGHPLSEKAKKLLHTTYTPRTRYPVFKEAAAPRAPVAADTPPVLQ